MGKKEKNIRFAVCVDNDGYPASLELHKIYRVLPHENAEADVNLRVVDESGEDYLYPARCFVSLSQTRFPPNWDEEKVRKVLAHYEEQTEEEATTEDEAATKIVESNQETEQ